MAKILIVDDEENIRLLFSEELQLDGYEVATADGGHGLLERIEREQPGLVLLDIQMPDYSGLDLLDDIRHRFPSLPVILCTAYENYKTDVKTVTASFYVIKSYDLTDLKKKIALALKTAARS